MKVLIGTKNPGKIEGAQSAFNAFFDEFEIIGIPVSSEVGDQPVNDEIYKGAKNRINNLVKYSEKNNLDVDYFLAIESGIINYFGEWMITNIATIRDKDGYESFGTSASFPVPKKYVDEIISTELSTLVDRIFDEKDARSGKGCIGLLTKDETSRIEQTKQAFIMALTKFINEKWTDKKVLIIK